MATEMATNMIMIFLMREGGNMNAGRETPGKINEMWLLLF